MAAPTPDPSKSIIDQEPTILLAMCIWGEARGQIDTAKIAVGNVVRNRVLAGIYGGSDWKNVILAPLQFSSFNANDPNRPKLLTPTQHDRPDVWDRCYDIANEVYEGTANDVSQRATHYYDKSMDLKPPFWANHFTHTVDIGNLRFFRDFRAYRDVRESPIYATEDVGTE